MGHSAFLMGHSAFLMGHSALKSAIATTKGGPALRQCAAS
jgi:hypothetical protein